MVRPVDHATGRPITSAVPTATGTHIDLLLEYSDVTYAHKDALFAERVVYWSGGLAFFALFGLRRRTRKICLGLLALCLVVSAAATLAGCGTSTDATVIVTATPTDHSAPAQTQEIELTYNDKD
jgi:hypothetical protein